MPIHSEWLDADRRLVLWRFESPWSWAEFARHYQLLKEQAETFDHDFDQIFDVSQLELLPPDVVLRVRREFFQRIPHTRYFLVVGADGYIQLLWNTLTSFPFAAHMHAFFFQHLEDAIAFSRDQRET